MKAVVFENYGSPDVLKLVDVDKPVPGAKEILVKIHAASVNALDWHFLRGTPFFLRFQFGMLRPKNRILGYDISGTIEAVGDNVTLFKTGDEVFGGLGFSLGGFAEYVCMPEDGLVVLKPPEVTFKQAATMAAAATTALRGLYNTGNIQAGQKVLINGASGGVGTFSVQIAKSYGAEVTGVCSTKNLELVQTLGADKVIDYSRDDFTENGQTYDLILDNVGNRTVRDLMKALKPTGKCVIIGFTSLPGIVLQSIQAPFVSSKAGKQILFTSNDEPEKKELLILKEMLENKNIVPSIDRVYPLEELADALRYIETKHASAKIVITM